MLSLAHMFFWSPELRVFLVLGTILVALLGPLVLLVRARRGSEPRCPGCLHQVTSLPTSRCPECGRSLEGGVIASGGWPPSLSRYARFAVVVLSLLIGAAVFWVAGGLTDGMIRVFSLEPRERVVDRSSAYALQQEHSIEIRVRSERFGPDRDLALEPVPSRVSLTLHDGRNWYGVDRESVLSPTWEDDSHLENPGIDDFAPLLEELRARIPVEPETYASGLLHDPARFDQLLYLVQNMDRAGGIEFPQKRITIMTGSSWHHDRSATHDLPWAQALWLPIMLSAVGGGLFAWLRLRRWVDHRVALVPFTAG